jgi:hypothetical protein
MIAPSFRSSATGWAITLLVITAIPLQAQDWRHQLAVGTGNNGRVAATSERFFDGWNAYGPLDDTGPFKEQRSTWEFAYTYRTSHQLAARLSGVIFERTQQYDVTNWPDAQGSNKLSGWGASLGLLHMSNYQKLEYGLGLDLPYYAFDDSRVELTMPDFQQIIAVKGGHAWGVGMVARCGLRVLKPLLLSFELRAGMLWYDLGGQWDLDWTYQGNTYHEDLPKADLRSREFSPLSVSIDLAYTFGHTPARTDRSFSPSE